jgi:hypothetical protein
MNEAKPALPVSIAKLMLGVVLVAWVAIASAAALALAVVVFVKVLRWGGII